MSIMKERNERKIKDGDLNKIFEFSFYNFSIYSLHNHSDHRIFESTDGFCTVQIAEKGSTEKDFQEEKVSKEEMKTKTSLDNQKSI